MNSYDEQAANERHREIVLLLQEILEALTKTEAKLPSEEKVSLGTKLKELTGISVKAGYQWSIYLD